MSSFFLGFIIGALVMSCVLCGFSVKRFKDEMERIREDRKKKGGE